MKSFLTLIFLASLPLFAQPDDWSTEDVGQGHLVICKQKNKVGIWSKARGEFLEPAHKGYIIHLPDPHFLLDVYPNDEEIKLYHYYKGGVQEFEFEDDSLIFWFGKILATDWNEKLVMQAVKPEHYKYLGENMLILKNADQVDPDTYSKFSFEFKDNYLRVNLIHTNTSDNNLEAIKSVLNPQEDSIDSDNNVVYYPRNEKRFYNSGVFDLKKGAWTVPPKYTEVNEWEGIYGAYYWPTDEEVDSDLKYDTEVYDFYKQTAKEGIQPTEFMKTQKFAFPLELWPFEDEEVWYDHDSIYVYRKNKKGVGMYEMPLRGKIAYYGGYSLEWVNNESHFEVKELFPPEYEYIVMGGNLDYFESPKNFKQYYILASKGDNIFDILFMDNEREEFYPSIDTLIKDVTINKFIELVPTEVWTGLNTKSNYEELTGFIDHVNFLRPNPKNGELDSTAWLTPRYKKHDREKESYYKSKFIGDDKMVVFSYEFEDWSSADPIMSVWGDDSTDYDGNTLYYTPDPGKYCSGLFDCKTSKWIIEPEMIGVSPGKGGYVIKRPVLDEEKNLKTIVVDFMKEDGTYEFKDLNPDEFAKPQYNKYKIYNYNPTEVWNVDPTNDEFVYFKTEEGIGLASIGLYRGWVMKKPTEMIYYQNYGKTIISIDGDTMDLTIYDAIDEDMNRIHFRFPIEAGSGLQVGGYADKNRQFELGESYYSAPKPLQFAYITADTTEYYEIKKPKSYPYNRAYYVLDTVSRPDPNYDFKKPFGPRDIGHSTTEYDFRVEVFTDELIYFQHNENSGDREYVKSIMYPDEDSIDFEGNVLFYPVEPGFTHSGVWNRTSKKWQIPNIYKDVEHISGNIFLIQKAQWNKDEKIIGSEFILHQDGKERILNPNPENDDYSAFFEVGKISDTLIYVNHVNAERSNYIPIESEVYSDEDSIDVEGNLVYYPLHIGEYKSGVYNVYTNEWVISKNIEKIHAFDEAFLVVLVILKEDGFIERRVYSLYDLDGNLLEEKVTFDKLDKKYQDKIND